MASFSDMLDRLRRLGPDTRLALRPPYPPVALGVDRDQVVLVRVKLHRRGKPVLDAHAARPLEGGCIPASIFQAVSGASEPLTTRLRELFEMSGTRPARVSLVLPDNLAKVSLLHLPERPPSPRQLDELVRSKMRRAVPFRLDDARLCYQVLPGMDRGVGVLVVLLRQGLVERFETGLAEIGARVGLIDICTPNLINLYRTPLGEASRQGRDAALFNCAANYFSLVIVRDERLIFFRCKTFNIDAEPTQGPNGDLAREVAGSFSYYREKLAGKGIGTAFVRSVSTPFGEIADKLRELGVDEVRRLDPLTELELANGAGLEPALGQRIAPALGAAAGRR